MRWGRGGRHRDGTGRRGLCCSPSQDRTDCRTERKHKPFLSTFMPSSAMRCMAGSADASHSASTLWAMALNALHAVS